MLTRRKPIPPALRLVIGLFTLVAIGTILLWLPISGSVRQLRFNEALFTAISALSVTGLSVIVPVRDLSWFGQGVLLVLIQIGGVGFMVIAVLILRLLGRRISLIERQALTDSLGLAAPGSILKLTQRMLAVIISLELLGAMLLYAHWRNDDRLSEGQAAFFALFHAVSAFCNAGFDLFSGTQGYIDGIPKDNLSLILLGSLIFIGGLGIPVIGDLLIYPRMKRLSLHTRITLLAVTFLILSGTVGFFFAEGNPVSGTLTAETPTRRLLIALFQSISARTAGFAGISAFTEITPASELLLITLMFIGCPPASMGGGITTGTFAVLTISLYSYARGLQVPQFGGRSLAQGTVRKAAAVLTVSLFVALLATWLILMTHPDAPLDLVVFEVISAFATCGLSLGFTDDLNLFGQAVIMFVMFWGRLGALTIVVALARPALHAQKVLYPEEQILIG
ncbi:MAG: potassium transporter [Oscillochloris sp.]|nr:potassium transporter [Oscillochloris sp.]